jgi:2-polyprenyl-3-methyl-5-hydroxy-6-metoxy-1,4-benzoquinol methylase
MKPDPFTSFPGEDEAAGGARCGPPRPGSLIEYSHRRTDRAIPHPTADAAFAAPGTTPIDLDDINNARSLAVLSVPPCSRVLDVGSGPGDVARALAARRCRVWAIDLEPDAIRLAERWCEGVLADDVETADLDTLLGSQRVDVVLFLDVLEHLHDPAAAIRRVVPYLAPGGIIILSVPHTAPATVRLPLLTGVFARASQGPLDRSHQHVFDRSSLYQLLQHAGVRVVDEARVVRRVEETGVALSLARFPQSVIDRATTGPDEDTCQFVMTVAPNPTGAAVEGMPALVGTLTERLHRLERHCRRLEELARDLEGQVDRRRGERDRALEEAREEHRRSAESAVAISQTLHRSELEGQRSNERLAQTSAELVHCQLEGRFLRDDLLVKDAYIATLREQASQRHESDVEIRALRQKIDGVAAERDVETKNAAALAASMRDMHQQLDRTRQELQQVHASAAATLAQPRYVIADRCNAWTKKAGFFHGALKRACAALSRRR